VFFEDYQLYQINARGLAGTDGN